MKRTIDFGKIAYESDRVCANRVTVTVELRDTKNGPEFSASGNIWNRRESDIVCGGQCLDTIAEYIKTPEFSEILRLWKAYHLNGMNAGTPEQDAAIDAWMAQGNRYDYTAACEHLRSLGIYEVEHQGKPYRYGTAWLYRAIPAPDLDRIREILRT